MHYVSWDRSDKDSLKLLAEDGPDVLAQFTHDQAVVDGAQWELVTSPESGAVATEQGVEIIRAIGSLKRDKTIGVDVQGRRYSLVNEASKNWIIDDEHGGKVAQFTQDHNGVRRAILEFEGETSLPETDIVALAWISRAVLESKKMVNSTVLIGFLVFLSAFIIIVFILQ